MFDITKLRLRSIQLFSLFIIVITSHCYASESPLIQRINISMAMTIAKSAGLVVQPVTAESGSQYLKTQVLDQNSAIMLLDCESGECSILKFYSIIEKGGVDFGVVNVWNSNYRYGRVYKDEDKVIVEADLLLHGGITQQSVLQFMQRQEMLVLSFQQQIGEGE